jgi:hypothetical protein
MGGKLILWLPHITYRIGAVESCDPLQCIGGAGGVLNSCRNLTASN